MPFEWLDYLVLAEELSKRNEESCARTAISRSYYYVFHLARQRLANNQFPIDRFGGDTHKQVWEKFKDDPDPRCQKLYMLAKELHGKRKQADYDIPFPGRTDAPAVVMRAKQFAAALAALEPRLPANRGFQS